MAPAAFSIEAPPEQGLQAREVTASRPRWIAVLASLVMIAASATAIGVYAFRRPHDESLAGSKASATGLQAPTDTLAPLAGDGTPVDWWFAFKFATTGFEGCSGELRCIFGGEPQNDRKYGLKFVSSQSVAGRTSGLDFQETCLGSGEDPVAKTFAQVYDGAANYIIWNDQFYEDPKLPNIHPKCNQKSCGAPWAHSKGVMAWDKDGKGFLMQVSTPDWPGNGDKTHTREEGNTLGCTKDNNVKVAQHFFALRLATPADAVTALQALRRASVVSDPTNPTLMKLSEGPAELAEIARSLGTIDKTPSVFTGQFSVIGASGEQVRVIAKPHKLYVPPWQMVSALVGKALRSATWWAAPKIASQKAGTPGCWDSSLPPAHEVQVVKSGVWGEKTFSLEGGPGNNKNHAKIGHSLSGSTVVLGDMNQQGSWDTADGPCDSSQNGRGGMFFIVDDEVLYAGVKALLTGETAAYHGEGRVED